MVQATKPLLQLAGRKCLIVLVASALAVVLAAGVAVTAYAWNSNGVPRGATVLGIDLGGLSRAGAADKLRAGLADRAEPAAPVTVHVADQKAKVQPADVGVAVDVDATVNAAAHSAFRFWGSHKVDPVVTVDAARLDTALRPVAAKVAQAMTKPAVTFTGTTPKAVYPVPGKGLDPQRAADALKGAWLREDVVDVPLADVSAATSKEDVDKLVADLARPAVSAPVQLTVGKQTLQVPPAAIAKSLVMTGDAQGRITPKVDVAKLRKALGSSLSTLETKPQEALIGTGTGAPQVIASTGGSVIDDAQLAKDLLGVLPVTGPSGRHRRDPGHHAGRDHRRRFGRARHHGAGVHLHHLLHRRAWPRRAARTS